MSVPVEEMERQRRVPVARPAVQQLALPAPTPVPAPQPGVPPTTVVPPRPDVVAVDRAGRASVASMPPRTPAAAALASAPRPSVINVNPAGVARPQYAPQATGATRLPPGVTDVSEPAATPRSAPARAAGSPAPRGLGQLGPLGRGIPVAAEGFNVVDAYQTGGADAAARQGINSAGRLAGAEIGAQIGGSLPLPGLGRPAAALLGGGVGWVAGDQLTQSQVGREAQLRGMQTQRLQDELAPRYDGRTNTVTTADGRMFGSGRPDSDPMQQVAGFIEGTAGRRVDSRYPLVNPTVAEMEALGTFGQQGGTAPAAGAAAQQLRTAPPPVNLIEPGSNTMPPTNRGPSPGERNTFTFSDGRTVDVNSYQPRAPLGQMNAQPTGAAAQLGAAPARAAGGGQGAVIGMPGSSTIERIDKAISDIGPLDRRGRRAAVSELLGLRNRVEQGGAELASVDARAAADVEQRTAASQLAAEVDREQIAATSANARRQNQQLVTGADGTTYAVNGTTLAPLTTADGQPFRAATKADNTLNQLASQLLQGQVESGMVTDPNAAAAQAAQAARALMSNLNAPAGMTYIGTQNGKPVYQNAQGQRFVGE